MHIRYTTAEIMPAIGSVTSQASNISEITFLLTERRSRLSLMPIIALLLTCVVETGRASLVAKTTITAVQVVSVVMN